MRVTVLAIIATLLLAGAADAQRISAPGDIEAYVAPATNCTAGYYGTPATPVTACGDDTSGNGSLAAPFATPQKAYDFYYQNYDFRGQYTLTIRVACAAEPGQFLYPGHNISGLLVGQPGGVPSLLYGDGTPPFVIGIYKPISILGCEDYPLGAFYNPGAGGRPNAIALAVSGGARVKVRGLAFDTTFANQDCIDVFDATLDIGNVVFGNAGNPTLLNRIQIGVAWGGVLAINDELTIAGSASSSIEIGSGGTVYWNNNGNPASPLVVNVWGTPSFSNGMFNATKGLMTIANVQFKNESGARPNVNGTVAVAKFNGVIDTATGNGSVNVPATCNPDYWPLNIAAGGVQVDVQDNGICR